MIRDCLLHKPPGNVIRFALLPEAEVPMAEVLMRRVLDVINALAPVARPLALDLVLACRTRELPFFEQDVFPAVPSFHIREEHQPPRVSAQAVYSSGRLEASVVPELTQDVLTHWCMTALAQKSPGPDYLVTFETLVCTYARARLFDEEPVRGLRLRDAGGNTWDAPIVLRDGEAWVAGPLEDRPMDAPISFRISNMDGRLDTHVQVGWALWDVPGTPEHRALGQALGRIRAQGWTPEFVPPGFATIFEK
ncbi:hypothetical protein F0U60_10215 [Archangium minus]|uniref:TIGR04255 family protein n=1 Tax=Archangium minus TaxID=83450 RepID=A0ABY9WNV0_9BACT|nr:hypothetical protein F0U60_10215 [Archangium minus]